MPVMSLYQAIRLAVRMYTLDFSHAESYASFTERFHAGNPNRSHWTERQFRESYDQWRREILKEEVRAEFRRKHFRELLALFLKGWSRRINLVTIALLTLAVLFPPYYITAGDQSVSMGLGFAWGRQVGRIDSVFVLCELVAIVALNWFALRVVQPPMDGQQSS